MKHKLLICALAALCTAACAPKTTVTWTEGVPDPETGKVCQTITIQNPPKDTCWTIWFAAFRIRPTIPDDSQGTIEHISGALHKITPRGGYGDSLVVKYVTYPLRRNSWAPERFVLDIPGKKPVELAAEYVFQPFEKVPEFEYNKVECRPEDMVPSLKKVIRTEGTTKLEKLPLDEIAGKFVSDCNVADKPAGWYEITINGNIDIKAADADGAFWAAVTLDNIRRNAGSEPVDNMVIEDWPDMQYRGVMLDVARNFTSKDNVLKLIDVLAHHKLNVLHLHLADDEGWRIFIPEIPQLTEFSAFHCLPQLQADGTYKEVEHLQPCYDGAFDPCDLTMSGNGFYSKEDFIEILQYAKKNHIRVIPEIDTPGHFRAALKACPDLVEPDDTSNYYSVQYYPDNAMNVALEESYKFMETIFDTFIAYYAEAGVELSAIHVGGDEVPGGAWMKSPLCRKLMEENGWTKSAQLKSYYVNRIMDLARAKGLKICGWQELALRHDDATKEKLKETLEFTNCWSSYASNHTDELPYQLANEGINVVLSTMTNAYADFAYNAGKDERGHDWGGLVDERRTYSLLPYDIYKSVRWGDKGDIKDISTASDGKTIISEDAKCHILGVQAQLWTETIRNFDHVTYYFFPKMTGLFERGWNATPDWAGTTAADDPAFLAGLDKFYSTVVQNEMPYYDEAGICYRKRD